MGEGRDEIVWYQNGALPELRYTTRWVVDSLGSWGFNCVMASLGSEGIRGGAETVREAQRVTVKGVGKSI